MPIRRALPKWRGGSRQRFQKVRGLLSDAVPEALVGCFCSWVTAECMTQDSVLDDCRRKRQWKQRAFRLRDVRGQWHAFRRTGHERTWRRKSRRVKSAEDAGGCESGYGRCKTMRGGSSCPSLEPSTCTTFKRRERRTL